MALIKCKKCGQPVSDKADFCSLCGAPVSGLGCTTSSIPDKPSIVPYFTTIKTNATDVDISKLVDNDPNKSKRKNIIRIITLTLFVVGIIFIIIGICSIFFAEELETIKQFHLERECEEQARIAREEQGISSLQRVDLGLSVCWAGWNVGATVPEEYGDYFAWGEGTSKESYSKYSYKYNDVRDYKDIGRDICGTNYDVARVFWGGNWRMPDEDEFRELLNRCNWTWITCNGVDGYKVTGPNGNSIFLPAAGCLSNRETPKEGFGCYWSGTLYDNAYRYNYYHYNDNEDCAYSLSFHIDGHLVIKKDRSVGNTVRPVCDK